MTWHNLPCPETLPSVSQLCPDGWLELYVEHVSPLRHTIFKLARAWGLDCDAFNNIKSMLVTLHGDATLSEVPDKATVLARVVRHGGKSERMVMGDAEYESLTPTSYTLDLQWGACAMPVYSMDPHPSLTGQQPAPQPGRGDMWQQVIERYQAQLQPAVLELFRQRRELGIAKYGVVLQAHNGRSIFKDLVGETLDRIVYAEQAATERPELADVMLGIQESDIATLGGLIMIYGRTAPDGQALP